MAPVMDELVEGNPMSPALSDRSTSAGDGCSTSASPAGFKAQFSTSMKLKMSKVSRTESLLGDMPMTPTTGKVTSPPRARPRVRTASAGQRRPRTVAAQLGRRPTNNPFIEYETREVRLARERRWLQTDEEYMQQRKFDLVHGSHLRGMLVKSTPSDRLYEDRLFYGNYSTQLKASQRTGSKRSPSKGQAFVAPGPAPPASLGETANLHMMATPTTTGVTTQLTLESRPASAGMLPTTTNSMAATTTEFRQTSLPAGPAWRVARANGSKQASEEMKELQQMLRASEQQAKKEFDFRLDGEEVGEESLEEETIEALQGLGALFRNMVAQSTTAHSVDESEPKDDDA